MCNVIAGKIRTIVASQKFEEFHKSYAIIIKESIFGRDENNDINPSLDFSENGLSVFSVDIQSVEPDDKSTKISL